LSNLHSVHPKGFEPLTVCLEGRCSIQLSYGCIQYVREGLPTLRSRTFRYEFMCVPLLLPYVNCNSYDGGTNHQRPSFSPLLLYQRPDSNRHEHYCSRDFKSLVSTNFTTLAFYTKYVNELLFLIRVLIYERKSEIPNYFENF
jgi:hypothetical protein